MKKAKEKEKKPDWKQASLGVGSSPFNNLFGLKRLFDRWDSKLKYEDYFLAWEVWWVGIWLVGYSVIVYVWLKSIIGGLPQRIAVFYGYHELGKLLADKSWLWFVAAVPSAFSLVIVILIRMFFKAQREMMFLWVVFQALISFLAFVTVLKMTTIYG